MKINREKALTAFKEYTDRYDSSRDMIRLKIEHTYRVCGLCQQVAKSLKLSEEEVDIAWLTGLLHDVGRFEQQRVYGTFSDAVSIDHAKYGARILFGEIWEQKTGISAGSEESLPEGIQADAGITIRDFVEDASEDQLLWTAVFYHSAYRIPEALDDRTAMFCHILRDADKIDILKVNVDFPLEEIYNVSTEVLYRGEVTPEVMESFDEEHAVLRSLKKTAVDNVVGHISLVYELVYPESCHIVKQQGYLDKLMSFESKNPQTRKQFAHIREHMQAYLESK